MKSPATVLRELLGDLNTCNVLGNAYDLAAEVAIDPAADMEDLLYDNVERMAKWERLVSSCQREVDKARDLVDEQVALFTVAYWEELKRRERAEMQALSRDEDEAEKDAEREQEGGPGFQLRRRQRAAVRVTHGPAACRWRRNFSDALLNARVTTEPKVASAKQQLRRAKAHLNTASCVLRSLGHRDRVLNHLCALHRDNARR